MGFFDSLLSKLKGVFRAILDAAGRFFDSLFQSEVEIVDNLQHIVDKFNETKLSIEHEVELIKNFKFDPKWKSRVINAPIAIKQMQELVGMVTGIFKGKLEALVSPIHDLALIFKSESLTTSDQDKPSAVARAAVKVDQIATMISQISKAMDVVAEVAHDFETVTQFLEDLDQVFLQQGNRQIKSTLTVRPRQGKLRHGETRT